MNKLLDRGQIQLIEPVLDKVFDGFDIVIRGPLNLLNRDRIFFRELSIDRFTQRGEQRRVDLTQLGQRQQAKGDQVLGFDSQSILNQGCFGKKTSQSRCLT